jgi:hypothetical protein
MAFGKEDSGCAIAGHTYGWERLADEQGAVAFHTLMRYAEDAEAAREMLKRLTEQVSEDLRDLGRRTPPGFVPGRQTDGGDEEGEFQAALRRVETAMRRAESAGVELVSATLDGEDTTVRLLRIGGVAAWWMSLSGDRVGWAERREGRLQLQAVTSPGSAADIVRAFDIAEGRVAPEWVSLPAEHVEVR